MRRVRVIPTLLLNNGGLVKSVKFKDYKYVGDPLNAVRIFNEKEVDEIVVLDISANRLKTGPDFEAIAQICAEAFMPLAYGGGISSLVHIKDILFNGAEKVVLNAAIFNNPNLITEAAGRFGSQAIVASIDVKKNLLGQYKVYKHNGQNSTGQNPVELAIQVEKLGAGEIFLNSIAKDGTYAGLDEDVITQVSQAVNIPVIACGGAASTAHLLAGIQAGASAVAAGSMFVLQRPHQAVLISYPSPMDLQQEIFSLL